MVVTPTTRNNRNARQVARKAIPLQKAHIHDTAVLANTDFLDTDLTPTDPNAMFRVMIQVDTATVFSAMVSDGSTEVELEFNAGANITAGALYIFDLLTDDGDSINFQVDDAVNIDKFIVQELLLATQ